MEYSTQESPIIFETTLREGLQTPGGIGANRQERLFIAKLLSNYAHYLELGMPANPVDYNHIAAIRDMLIGEQSAVGIGVLARCHPSDIQKAEEVMKNYGNSLIHLFIGTSEEHRNNRFGGGKSIDDYCKLISESVEQAASLGFDHVMFSPEDAYRTYASNAVHLKTFIQAAQEGYERGNTRQKRNVPIIFNLPDTVGVSSIYEFSQLLDYVTKEFPNIELSVHCHNDSGMADAHTFYAYEKFGVRYLQSTIDHLGERNGIASTDLLIKNLYDRGRIDDERIIKNLPYLDKSRDAILAALGRTPSMDEQRKNVSTSGIHTDLVGKSADTYHIRSGQYGSKPIIELGPTSGKGQVIHLLKECGVHYDEKKIDSFTLNLKQLSNDRKSPLSITEILYEAELLFNNRSIEDLIVVEDYTLTTTKKGRTTIEINYAYGGEQNAFSHESGGPVEAAMEGLQKIINTINDSDHRVLLTHYQLRIIPNLDKETLIWNPGEDPTLPDSIGFNAELAVDIGIENGSGEYFGWAMHENSTNAKVNSVFDAMTKMFALQKWGH